MSANAVVRARINEEIKNEAVIVLASMGLTVSDAFRMMLTRVAVEKALRLIHWCPMRRLLPMRDALHGKVESF